MQVFRSEKNPLIKPQDVTPSRDDFEVIGVFNAAVARLRNETILLLRVAERPICKHPDKVLTAVYDAYKNALTIKDFSKNNPDVDFSDPRLIKTPQGTYLTSISHLRLARSTNGIDFEIEDKPAITAANQYETFGIEDPRISFIDDTYYITYVSVSPAGVTTSLISTKDFNSYHRHGIIFCPDNKDAIIFNGKVNNTYYALHRPDSHLFNNKDIWIAQSNDIICWGNHRQIASIRDGFWDDTRIGPSAVPFMTEHGWLEIYHGADKNNRYCLGALLLDAERPWIVLARSTQPLLQPQTDYECNGFFGNVIFTCGLLCEEDKLKIYYGAADVCICYAEIAIKDVFKNLNM